jgi:hypothetical protein
MELRGAKLKTISTDWETIGPPICMTVQTVFEIKSYINM